MSADLPPRSAQKKGVQPSLTLCESPELDWSRADVPASETFGDIYFSVEGGLEETRNVYLKACGLPQRWSEPKFASAPFVVGELGFGTGLNFLALWQLWSQHRRPDQRLHFVSVEKFPLSTEDLARALGSWPELREQAQALLKLWPDRVRGTHVLHFDAGLTLTLIHDDVEAALSALSMRADAWFLDGFSPAKNPAMWSASVLSRVGALSAARARIGTFTAAGFVREGLAAAGFEVKKTVGFGRKRHRLEAVMPDAEAVPNKAISPDAAAHSQNSIQPLIIGAGIAGVSLAAAFARRGITAVLIDPADGTAASANAAAIVKPRLDRQDSPLARFALNSYLYALQTYDAVGAVRACGVTHLPQEAPQIARYKALMAEPSLPLFHMYWEDGAAVFPKAQVIDPNAARAAMLAGAQTAAARVHTVQQTAAGYAALDDKGHILGEGTHVFWAVGAGARGRAEFAPFDLRYSRGQISWARSQEGALSSALTYGGYAVPVPEPVLEDGSGDEDGNTGDMLLGATHDRLGAGDPYAVRADDDARNFDSFKAATGQKALPSPRKSRASVRVNSKTTWPFTAQILPGVHVLTGLGSRGFVFAPLMGEMLAADICGDPVVWPAKLRRDVSGN